MDLKFLFTSFDGRIGRQQWWIGTIILFVIALVLYFVLLPVLGLSMMSGFDPAGGPDALMSMMRKAAIGQVILTAIFAYPATALMKKRLNDRDRPGWFVAVFWAPTVVNLILGLAGLNITSTDMGGGAMPAPSSLSMIVGLIALVIGIWSLVELGILRGTQGPNKHGPDPLA
jgi:uncharacterized membrane protein YhaH (DUF805 family)